MINRLYFQLDETWGSGHMQLRLDRSLILGVAVIAVTAMPISLGGTRLFNETILPLALAVSLLFLVSLRSVQKLSLYVLIYGFTWSIVFLLGLLLSAGGDFVFKDFVEPIKPAIYALIFVMGYEAARGVGETVIVKWIVGIALVSCVFSFLVYMPTTYPLLDLYKGRPSADSHPVHFYRFSGLMGYPGVFSYWLALSILVLFSDSARTVFGAPMRILLGVFFLIAFVLTGARGGIIVLSLAALTFFAVTGPRNIALKVALLIGFVSTYFLLFLPNITAITDFYPQANYLVAGFEDIRGSTAAHRFREFGLIESVLTNNPIFGLGPSNAYLHSMYGPVENVYFYYGVKFGILGLLFYASIVVFSAVMLGKSVSTRPTSPSSIFFIWAVVCLVVGSFNEAVTEEYKSFFYFFLALGFFSRIGSGGQTVLARSNRK